MKSAVRIAILALALALAAGSAWALVGPGKVLPDISLPDDKGKMHSLPEMVKGKAALIVYWSVSCSRCRRDIPQVLSLARRLEGNPFVVLFVNTDGKAMTPAVRAYAKQEGLTGPVLMDIGPDDTLPLADAYDIIATPGLLVLDSSGKLVLAQELDPDMEKIKRAIRQSM